jgi:hypothetical protein
MIQISVADPRIRTRMFLDLPHPDPSVRGTDPDPSIIKQNYVVRRTTMFCDFFRTFIFEI